MRGTWKMDNEKLWQKLGQVKWTGDDQQNSWRKVTQKVNGRKRRTRYKYAISTVGLLALFSIVLWQLLVLPSYESKTQFQQQHTADLFITGSYVYENEATQEAVDFLSPFFWDKEKVKRATWLETLEK